MLVVKYLSCRMLSGTGHQNSEASAFRARAWGLKVFGFGLNRGRRVRTLGFSFGSRHLVRFRVSLGFRVWGFGA